MVLLIWLDNGGLSSKCWMSLVAEWFPKDKLKRWGTKISWDNYERRILFLFFGIKCWKIVYVYLTIIIHSTQNMVLPLYAFSHGALRANLGPLGSSRSLKFSITSLKHGIQALRD